MHFERTSISGRPEGTIKKALENFTQEKILTPDANCKAQKDNVEGFYKFDNGKNQLGIALVKTDSCYYNIWVTVDSNFQFSGRNFYSTDNQFHYFSAGRENRINSTCIIQGKFIGSDMAFNYYDSICFLYKLKDDKILL